jgi:alpha-tubulin suppressor-like RCC1 family protein
VLVPGLSGITQLAQGADHMLAAGAGGVVRAWAHNDYGQLGDGTTTERNSPGPVPGLTGITQLAAGGVSYALRSDGTLFAWGGGIVGNGSDTVNPAPVTVPLAGVTQVATGGADTLAIAGPSHTVYAWGHNFAGEIGNGTQHVQQLTPAQLNLSGVIGVSEGQWASAAIRSDGSLFTPSSPPAS